MSLAPARSLNFSSLDAESAAALDEAMDALQNGKTFDDAAFLTRFPHLAELFATFKRLIVTQPTVPCATLANDPPQPASIGPYRIERELGAGSFGIVYLAYDPDVDRRVALKVLHPRRLEQPEAVRRFQREARAIARLQHPGILQLYDYSRQGPPYYLVTEYLEGVNPRTWAQQQRLDVNGIVELVIRIAEAVYHAHEQGVYHRDLKPENILIDANGNPHVLDFGLARLDVLSAEASTAGDTSDDHILGSVPYMPPEQADGRSHSADARSDVYSLGIILYELLAGRRPFQGTLNELLRAIIEEPPPSLRSFNRAIPFALEVRCLKALEKHPADRHEDGADLANDLRGFLNGEPIKPLQHAWLRYLQGIVGRRHRDTLVAGWPSLLLVLGVTIFVGCVLMNCWELALSQPWRAPAMLLTKVVQVAAMLFVAVRLRPVKEARLTAAERQIWTLLPAYYGGFLTLLAIQHFAPNSFPLAAILAVLSGMGFGTLGATIWGWLYVWSVAFFVLAVVILFCGPYGLTLLGLGWLLCLSIGSIQLRWTR